MTRSFILLTILLIHSSVFAERYMKARIILLNGTILEGMASFPETPTPVPIHFKTDKKAKSQSINSDDIKTIVYIADNGKTIEFDRLSAYVDGPSEKPIKAWLSVSIRGEVTLYKYASADIAADNAGRYDVSQTSWLCYRQGEAAATKMSSTDVKNKKNFFVLSATAYFKDDGELAKKIQTGRYNWSDVDKIVAEYNEWRKNKQ
jgi:hypothetical protein